MSKHRKDDPTLAADPLAKLRSKNSIPNSVVRSTPYTVTINVEELHNVVAVDGVTIAKVANKRGEEVEEVCIETSLATKRTILNYRQSTYKKQKQSTWHDVKVLKIRDSKRPVHFHTRTERMAKATKTTRTVKSS